MKKLTALIIDDECHGRENLKLLIETYCNEIEVLAAACSVAEGKELVRNLSPEVVFLDVNMPVLDGFDFLEYYDDRDFFVVIVSAHQNYGVQAVKVNVDDYLLKPVNIKELQQTVKKLVSMKKETEAEKDLINNAIRKITLPVTNGFEVLDVNDIIRFEADGCYTKIFLKNGKMLCVSKTLKEFESLSPGDIFYRVHKSHLINIQYLKEFTISDGGYATLSDGSMIEISRRKAPEFLQKIKKMI